jgi:Zn-dependent protease with chaperone function
MLIDAVLYDGKRSQEHVVTIAFDTDRRVRIASHGIEVMLEEIKISSRLGDTPRLLEFPNGIRCKSRENDKIDQILQDFDIQNSKVHKIESSLMLSLGAVVITIAFVVFMLTSGANYTANMVASLLPQNSLDNLSHITMEHLEEEFLSPSTLSKKQQKELQNTFALLSKGDTRYHLHLRSSPQIGANAFALPSGDIVLTDQLVMLSRDSQYRDILGVLAHEKGHVVYQHTLRMAIKTGLAGVIIGYLTGDISFLATLLPTILINSSYSREFEREADAYAVRELQEMNLSTIHIANLFERLAAKEGESNREIMALISSHPLTDERIEYFKSFAK